MTWEERTKVGATLLSLVAIVIGGSQFIQNQRILAATPFLQKKLEWCEKAVKTVSALAVNDQPNPEDEQEFWQLYWGLMVLIEMKASRRRWLSLVKHWKGRARSKVAPKIVPRP